MPRARAVPRVGRPVLAAPAPGDEKAPTRYTGALCDCRQHTPQTHGQQLLLLLLRRRRRACDKRVRSNPPGHRHARRSERERAACIARTSSSFPQRRTCSPVRPHPPPTGAHYFGTCPQPLSWGQYRDWMTPTLQAKRPHVTGSDFKRCAHLYQCSRRCLVDWQPVRGAFVAFLCVCTSVPALSWGQYRPELS